jgi:hypothetical protein
MDDEEITPALVAPVAAMELGATTLDEIPLVLFPALAQAKFILVTGVPEAKGWLRSQVIST